MDIQSRLARVEERLDNQGNKLDNHIAQDNAMDNAILEKLEQIQGDISRVKGFTTGVAAAFGVIGAGASFLWDKITSH
ncbi:MAG: hypothetical protein ACXWT4_06035 [Methylobacter sp.]